VEYVHVVDGLDTLPVALYPVIEAAANLVHITLLLFAPRLCVSGLSFLELLLLPQRWSFRMDAVKDDFPFFFYQYLQFVQTFCLSSAAACRSISPLKREIALHIVAFRLRAGFRFCLQMLESVFQVQPKYVFSCALRLLELL